jgi:hypothetical protein
MGLKFSNLINSDNLGGTFNLVASSNLTNAVPLRDFGNMLTADTDLFTVDSLNIFSDGLQ